MQIAGQFCLQWSEYKTNIERCFMDVRQAGDFSDVTLLCEDDQITAHKLVLSAGSDFFRETLRKVSHPHPLIYMRGVNKKEIGAVLDFLYNGQATVELEDLSRFFDITKELRIKGILERSAIEAINEIKTTSSEEVYDYNKPNEFKTEATSSLDNINELGTGGILEGFKGEHVNENISKDTKILEHNLDLFGQTNSYVDYDYKDTASQDEDETTADVDYFRSNQSLTNNKPNLNRLSCPFSCGKSFNKKITLLKHKLKAHKDCDMEISESNPNIKIQENRDNTKLQHPKPGSVWQYFTINSPDTALCTICNQVIRASTKILRRHLQGKHLYELPEFRRISLEQKESDRNQINTQRLSNDSPFIPSGHERKSSAVWKHCTRLSQAMARCNICEKIIPCTGGSTGGLKRHLVKLHDKDLSKNTSDLPSKDIWDNFTMKEFEQKDCLSIEDFTRTPSEEPGEGKPKSLLWKYFDKIDDCQAQCSLCGKQVDCLNSRSGMRRHLISSHTAKVRKVAKCNACDYFVEMDQGGRKRDMFEHLETFHRN